MMRVAFWYSGSRQSGDCLLLLTVSVQQLRLLLHRLNHPDVLRRRPLHADRDLLALHHRTEHLLAERRMPRDRLRDLTYTSHRELAERVLRLLVLGVDVLVAVDGEGVDEELGGVGVQPIRRNVVRLQVGDDAECFHPRHGLDAVHRCFLHEFSPEYRTLCFLA